MAKQGVSQSILDTKPSLTSTITTRSIASASSSQDDITDALEEQVLGRIKGDYYIVTWHGPGDKGNPQNLPLWRKWLVTMSVALYVLTTTFASSVFSAAVVVTADEFGVRVETMVCLCIDRRWVKLVGNVLLMSPTGHLRYFNVHGRLRYWTSDIRVSLEACDQYIM
jgi:hypothetical protein